MIYIYINITHISIMYNILCIKIYKYDIYICINRQGTQGPTWWREKTDSGKLSLSFQTWAMAYVPPSNKLLKRIFNRQRSRPGFQIMKCRFKRPSDQYPVSSPAQSVWPQNPVSPPPTSHLRLGRATRAPPLWRGRLIIKPSVQDG